MFDIKKALKNGMKKKMVYLFIYKNPYNNKEKFIIVDDLKAVKKFGDGDYRQVTMYTKV